MRGKPSNPPAPAVVETEVISVTTVNQPTVVPPKVVQAQPSKSQNALPALVLPSASPEFAEPRKLPQAANKPAPVQLTLGEGEGDQPPPAEPPEAVLDGEEGTVVVRMTVDEDGRVREAEAVVPSRWLLLNNAAVRTIRTTWRFRKGPVRIYEVSIEFVINRHD